MNRLACIDLKAFPLQLLLRRERAWRDKPVAVVAEDKPNAKILWLNEHARTHGILPGMRYSAGLALCADLCAGTVADTEIERAIKALTQRLRHFGPDIEPHAQEPGVFWVGDTGLERLGIHRSARQWAEGMDAAFSKLGLSATIVVGFTRFASYALAKSLREPMVWLLRDAAEEHASRLRVALSRLHLDPKVRDDLHALGVETVGDLLKLPADGLQERFGKEVYKLHREARGPEEGIAGEVPVQRAEEHVPLRETMVLDDPERDVARLLFGIKRLLDPLLERLAENRQALAALTLELQIEGKQKGRLEKLQPASPTLDSQQVLDLLYLRLESLKLRAGVVDMALQVEGIAATRKQLELFADRPKRDPEAIRRAFARLRAEFGANTVVHARLREGHLPEASYEWVPLDLSSGELPKPKPRLCRRTLVRRMRAHAWALPHRPRHEEDGWQLRGRDDTAVHDLRGPYVISGGWWRSDNAETAREYYFAGTRKGEWLWVYRDRRRRRWFLQGRVE